MIPVGAASREQAEILYRQAEGFVLRTPGMRQRFKCQEGYRRVKCLRTGGRLQVYAADDRTGDGIIPGGVALLDELHRQRDLRLLRTWVGKLGKRGAQLVGISTAGEPGSEFEEARARIHRQALEVIELPGHVRVRGEGIILHDYRVARREDAKDMAIVAQSNPLPAITPETLAKKHASPTMTDAHWLRMVCNIASRETSTPITPELLDPLAITEVEDPDLEGFGWLDLGWKIDTTAVGVLLWESDERRIAAGFKVLEPPVDEADIVAAILHLQLRFTGLRGFVMDPNAGGQQMAQLLEKGEHPLQTDDDKRARYDLPPLNGTPAEPLEFWAHSQDPAPMSQASMRLDEALRGSTDEQGDLIRPATLRWVKEGDWEAFRRHCLNGARKDISTSGDKWRYDRPADAKGERRKKYPNDALIGLAMGHNIAIEEIQDESGFTVEVFG
jgi:hypothetical protein